MKKIVVFLVVVVFSLSQLSAQKSVSASVDKLVYPGVVFGTNFNSGSCYNITPLSPEVSSDSGVLYCMAEWRVYSFGFREKFMIQYFRMRSRLLDHLLA